MNGPEIVLPALLAAVALGAAGVALWLTLGARRGAATDPHTREALRRLSEAQSELAGRLGQMGENQAAVQAQLAERLQAQEQALARTVDQRLGRMQQRLDEGLEKSHTRTHETLSELKERLAVIDAAQKNIASLSEQVVSLQDVLSNKQARGAFGEIQLNDLVQAALPPSAYAFQARVGEGRRADCLIRLPNPPGPIVVDAKFPLESWQALRDAADDTARAQAGRAFATAVQKHVRDIAARYIVPGETADSALMFLPSESVYADLHANFRAVVEEAFRHRVWIVSPTTLMATLNTVRAVLKDARMREQAGLIQAEVEKLLVDVGRLDDRTARLQRHFEQAGEDIRQIRISTEKIDRRGNRIGEMEVGEDEEEENAPLSGEAAGRLPDQG